MQKVVIENGKVVSVSGHKGMGVLLADLSESNTETDNASNQSITKTDSKTNIQLEASSDVIPDNTIMDVIEITSEETLDKIKNTLTKIESFKAFDITLKANDTNIQPNGKVKISIPIPEGFNASRLIVYRLDENNTTTEYQVTDTNGYATFETDHFSIYVLGEKTITGGNDAKLPQTGEETNTFARWLSIAIALGIFWICSMLFIEHEKKKMMKK